MIIHLSETNAASISSSLPLMKSKRDALEAAMSRYLSHADPGRASEVPPRVAAGAIMDMLFDHAARVSSAGEIVRIDRHRARHHRLGIDGRHYSAFGDGLAAIMKDVLGAEARPARLAAWGDAYWAIVSLVAAAPLAMAA
jgi:hemoglobin-like flavoprotein